MTFKVCERTYMSYKSNFKKIHDSLVHTDTTHRAQVYQTNTLTVKFGLCVWPGKVTENVVANLNDVDSSSFK